MSRTDRRLLPAGSDHRRTQSAPMTPPPGGRLRNEAAFMRYWASRAVSFAGASITAVVLPILIYQRTGSPAQTSLLFTIETLPYLVLGLWAGARADRIDRRRIMVVCDVSSALAIGSIPVAAALDVLTNVQIYAVAFVVASLWVLRRRQLGRASSDGRDEDSADRFLWRERLMRNSPGTSASRRTLTLLEFGTTITSGAVFGLLVVFAVRHLGVPDDDARIGIIYAAGGVGALVASIALPSISRRFAPAHIAVVGMTSGWLLIVGLASIRQLALAALLYLAFEIALVVTTLNVITYRQRVTPDHLQSRVNVFGRMIAWGGHAVGAALAGVLATFVDVGTAILIMSTAIGVSAIIGLAGPLRYARPGPRAP